LRISGVDIHIGGQTAVILCTP